MSNERWKTVEEAPEPWYRRRGTRNVALVLAGAAAVAFLFVPERRPQSPHAPSAGGPSASEDLFQNAASLLNRLEQINTPDVMAQVVGGFNRWLEDQGSDDGWQSDPLFGTLPKKYADRLPTEFLASPLMTPQDGDYLEESIALRDVARVARGDSIDEVTRATHLFDWTVRNLQLDPPRQDASQWRTIHPLRIMLQGHADALQRAWIFILLARQQQLDVVMLGVGDPNAPGGLRSWAPALWSNGELYVFESSLGLAIPGPENREVATLAQLAADDSLLRRLDLDAEHRYPMQAGDLARVVAFVEARPVSLSRRMRLIETALSGDQKMVLASSPSRVAESLRACPQIAETRVWPFPFDEWEIGSRFHQDPTPETIEAMGAWNMPFQLQPMLEMGRKFQFKGNFTGENDELGERSANMFYQACRLASGAIEDRVQRQAEDIMRNEPIPPEQWERKMEETKQTLRKALRRAMESATYWLGVIAYERGRYDTAIDYFKVRTLEEAPRSFFVPGARYNLARCYEAQGDWEQAVAVYEADDSAQRYGNLLRARWLRGRAQPASPAASE